MTDMSCFRPRLFLNRVSYLALPAVVEELGAEELVHLVGHRVHGVVGEVGAGLVAAIPNKTHHILRKQDCPL